MPPDSGHWITSLGIAKRNTQKLTQKKKTTRHPTTNWTQEKILMADSTYKITDEAIPDPWIFLLNKGLKFVPAPEHWNHHQWCSEVNIFTTKLTNHWYFKNRSSHTSSRQDPLKQAFKDINRPKINNWVAPIKQLPPPHFKAISDLRKERYECNPSTVWPNITSKERRIIREIKSRKTLVI